MRTQKEIQADITRLNAELKATVAHETKHKAAVHILENLGWTHTALYGWKRPAAKEIDPKELDEYSRGVIRSGDFVRVGTSNCFYVVREVNGARITAQEILAVYASGMVASPATTNLTRVRLLQVSRDTLSESFKNHPFAR